MVQKYKGDITGMIKTLYHGTGGTAPNIILQSVEGFDLKYCSWFLHGKGNYFSPIPDYCDNGFVYEIPNSQPWKFQIIVVEVFVGHYSTKDILDWTANNELGGKIIKKNPKTNEFYDSVTDSMNDASR